MAAKNWISPQERYTLGLWKLCEVGRLLGIREKMLRYHQSLGIVPAPNRYARDGKCYYDEIGIEAVKEYFAGRRPWQHTKQKTKKA